MKTRAIAHVLTLATAASLITAILQMKGWGYHFYPLVAFGGLLFAILVFDARAPRPPWFLVASDPRLVVVWMMLLVIATAARTVDSVRDRLHHRKGVFGELLRAAQSTPEGSSILVLSTSMYPAFPLVNQAQARWASRFPFLWPLPGLRAAENDHLAPRPHASDLASMERTFMDAVIADLAKERPSLVIVDDAPVKQGFGAKRFDYLEYLARDGRFSEIWADYEPIGTAGAYALFRNRESLPIPAAAATHRE